MTPDAGLAEALQAARKFRGATAPNPPVGAAALDREGKLLGTAAHERAGEAHAEAALLARARAEGWDTQIHRLVVTLEPCNHQGRTPPCTHAILAMPLIREVVYGARDPNPKVAGAGAERLRAAGLQIELASGVLHLESLSLIAPFAKLSLSGRPWVTVKIALDREGRMIPPKGTKTFTSPESLDFAHELRKRADALITGSGTVLADRPELTVRRVPDFQGKRRHLVVLDRRGLVPRDWINLSESRGFLVRTDFQTLEKALDYLGSQGVLEALVEAGPNLSKTFLSSSLWDEHVVISQAKREGEPDRIETRFRATDPA